MNTLPSRIGEALLLQYSDDTTLICSGSDPAAIASVTNRQLALIHDWLVEHRMRFNEQKSHVMWFHVGKYKLKSPHVPISIHGVTLTNTERQKYLGLIFNTQLSWDFQMSNVCKKMSYYLYMIKSHGKVLNFAIMKLLIESLVFSHLTYAICVWGLSLWQHSVKHLKRLKNRSVHALIVPSALV